MDTSKVGRWAFLAGLALSILLAFLSLGDWVVWALPVLGLIVGFLNVAGSETQGFLIAAIALAASAGAVNSIPGVGETVTDVMGNVVVFISPAMLVVAVKYLLESAKG